MSILETTTPAVKYTSVVPRNVYMGTPAFSRTEPFVPCLTLAVKFSAVVLPGNASGCTVLKEEEAFELLAADPPSPRLRSRAQTEAYIDIRRRLFRRSLQERNSARSARTPA